MSTFMRFVIYIIVMGIWLMILYLTDAINESSSIIGDLVLILIPGAAFMEIASRQIATRVRREGEE